MLKGVREAASHLGMERVKSCMDERCARLVPVVTTAPAFRASS
jgi:hypothetical protein